MIQDGTLLETSPVVPPASAVRMAQRAMSAEDFGRFSAVTLHDITYASSGLRIKGWMALPPAGQQTYPVIIFNRGGTGPRGAIGAEGAMAFLGLYASWGYVAIASNYRGHGGSEGGDEWGAGDVDDAMALLPLLDSLPYVDRDRIGIVGGSRGGMMVFRMLTRTQRFRAAVTFGAPTALHTAPDNAYIRKTMVQHLAADSVVQEEAEKRSVLTFASHLCRSTPLMVLHGSGDKRVPAEHALTLGLELQRLHHPYKMIIYDNADHVLAGRRTESNADIRWWMDQYVRDAAPLPRTGPHGA